MLYEITFSPTSGTKHVTDRLVAAFPEASSPDTCKHIDLLQKDTDYSTISFTTDDICFVAVPAFGGRVPATATQRLSQMRGNGAKAILVCVYGNRAYEDVLIELKDTLQAAGFTPAAAVAAISEHSIMRQFATGRPDAADLAALADFSQKIYHALTALTGTATPVNDLSANDLTVPGNRPYKTYGVIPFLPVAPEGCTNCGICAAECPVGAIDPATPQSPDASICIGCMRCIYVCPEKVKAVDPAQIQAASTRMAPLFASRKENELFL